MASRKAWGEFFARHTEKYPGGVIDTLLTDWLKAKANAEALHPSPSPPPPPERRQFNRDTPRRIAQMLAERIKRGK